MSNPVIKALSGGREHKYNKTQLYDIHSRGIFMRWLMGTLSVPDCNANSHTRSFGREKSFRRSLCRADGVEWGSTTPAAFLAHLLGSDFYLLSAESAP